MCDRKTTQVPTGGDQRDKFPSLLGATLSANMQRGKKASPSLCINPIAQTSQ